MSDITVRSLISGKEVSWQGTIGDSEGVLRVNGYFVVRESGGWLRMDREVCGSLVIPT